MTTYKTGNALGSSAPKDLFDNAENLDLAVNDTANPTWEDRFGVKRETLYGALKNFKDNGGALAFANEAALLAYVPESPNVLAIDTGTGSYWIWDGTSWAITSFHPAQLEQVTALMALINKNDAALLYEVLVDEEGGILRKYSSTEISDLFHTVRSTSGITSLGGDEEGGRLIYADDSGLDIGPLRMRYSPLPGIRVIDSEGAILQDISDPGEAPVLAGSSTLDDGVFFGSRKIAAFAGEAVNIHVPSLVSDRLAAADILASIGSLTTPAQLSGYGELKVDIDSYGSQAVLNLRPENATDGRYGALVDLIPVPASTTSTDINILMIGDSIGNRQGPLYLSQYLSEKGYTAKYIGTLNTSRLVSDANDASGALAECREGWESGDFTGAVTDRISIVQPGAEAAYLAQDKTTKWPQNPFLRVATSDDPADIIRNGWVLDFAFYATRFSLTAPDVIIYSVGTNDVRDRPEAEIYSNVLDSEALILNRLRAAWPNAKIIRMLPPTAMDTERNALWSTKYTKILRAMGVVNTQRADTKTMIAPTWAFLNTDNGYRRTFTGVDPDTGFGKLTWADAVHPYESGRPHLYQSLAPYVAATYLNLI
ncbi:SGNH/GDSL hydrolase family protein [Pantoea sp. A4]|uniref:SGNH/GDSL hydrolase family protein n=1 Tax=Pantoea sp. A4 TaxID=1225184 RepID=UPI0003769247|nr:SGNH/GDSL hydrolase family protein [Pantoea sp. A4]